MDVTISIANVAGRARGSRLALRGCGPVGRCVDADHVDEEGCAVGKAAWRAALPRATVAELLGAGRLAHPEALAGLALGDG